MHVCYAYAEIYLSSRSRKDTSCFIFYWKVAWSTCLDTNLNVELDVLFWMIFHCECREVVLFLFLGGVGGGELVQNSFISRLILRIARVFSQEEYSELSLWLFTVLNLWLVTPKLDGIIFTCRLIGWETSEKKVEWWVLFITCILWFLCW